jgi:tetratricopeptide (TPR) repeat protein
MTMVRPLISLVPVTVLLASCASNPDRQTLAGLHNVEADVEDVTVEDSLERAMDSYRRFLEETPEGVMTPEALRRLADLQIENAYGIMGSGEIIELPAPAEAGVSGSEAQSSPPVADLEAPESASRPSGSVVAASANTTETTTGFAESDEDFESRTTETYGFESAADSVALELPDGSVDPSLAGPLEAIAIYKRILEEYPYYERNDQVVYQMARAYDEIGQPEEAMAVMERLAGEYGYSRYLDEIHFRRGEFLFTRRQYFPAEEAYSQVVAMGPGSSYYELALYKLGWSLYKQELYEEALHQYMALLDYKQSIGYDFDASHDEADERRVTDTYRVISLSFSNLGGPEVVNEYFGAYGSRSYEDRIYSNLGEFYLTKLRYQDAAAIYGAFVELNPFHRVAPRFSMRVAEIYADGGFPLLVVEAKKDFATRYGLQSEYWHHFDTADSPEVVDYLKANLTDLANHYHALYQEEAFIEERPENFGEASYWYREFLGSFPEESESPSINYQLADLLLENEDFGEAAIEYERTAYDYPDHEQSAAAGYAAVFAHREDLSAADELRFPAVRRATVTSSLRFAETFPAHEHAPPVLGAAADDLYEMQDYETAISSARTLIDSYPNTEAALRRSAWLVVAHSSFELEDFPTAEPAYVSVLDLTAEDDESREPLIENLAASIYKQGEAANVLGDFQAAADHFLRVKRVTPTSQIRPAAEYDAAAALIRHEDWPRAASVLEDFRSAFPEHELQHEVTKQLASVYRQGGQLDRSASEYERVAAETDDPVLRGEAMLLAGELYEEASSTDSALDVYMRYVAEFPEPLDLAQETRFKIAGMHESRDDLVLYHEMLEEIVAVDSAAGASRTDRSRYLAAQSALVLTERLYASFVEVELVQPFEQSLAEKQQRMDTALAGFEGLVGYAVGEVTAAATFYIAEIYFDFSAALLGSERPTDLEPATLVEYELALEEEAFPFEEQAIEVHEANFELISAGLYNEWVRKSLERLSVLMPGRYAKAEISTGFIGAIDTYAYRSPSALIDTAQDDAAAPQSGEPTASASGELLEPAVLDQSQTLIASTEDGNDASIR